MLSTIKGYYDKGKITLAEIPPFIEKAEVMVTFLPEKKKAAKKQKRVLGALKGKITVPDDFDEPLEDLKDYM